MPSARPIRGVTCAAITALALLVAPTAGATPFTTPDDAWIVNGSVSDVVHGSGIAYLAGNFDLIGPITGSAPIVDVATSTIIPGTPVVDGSVNAAISDGAGGFIIGGSFSSVNGVARTNIARIRADGTLDTTLKNVLNGDVLALAADATSIYLSGYFNRIDGQDVQRVARITRATGALDTAYAAAVGSFDSYVYALAIGDSGQLYVGGDFSQIGGVDHLRLAALKQTGAIDANFVPPAPPGSVFAITPVPGATRIYVGGAGGFVERRNAGTGAVDSAFTAAVNNAVRSIAVTATRVYIGGLFNFVNNTARNYLAALTTTGTLVAGFDANVSDAVRSIAVAGGALHAGGDFLDAGSPSQTVRYGAAFDLASGALKALRLKAGGSVRAVAGNDTGAHVLFGGDFPTAGGQPAQRLAAISLAAGRPVPGFDAPTLDIGSITTLAVSDGRLIIGGSFGAVDGQSRPAIAALDGNTGDVVAGFAPSLPPPGPHIATALTVSTNGILYAGLQHNNEPDQYGVFAFNATTGARLTGFQTATSAGVFRLALGDSRLFALGNFGTITGAGNVAGPPVLAALDRDTGTPVTSFDARVGDGFVSDMVAQGGRLYVGGNFIKIGGEDHLNLAALDQATGTAISGFRSDTTLAINALGFGDGTVYAAGQESRRGIDNSLVLADTLGTADRSVVGTVREGLIAVDPASGALQGWGPFADPVSALAVDGSRVSIGGAFQTVNRLVRRGFATFTPAPPPPPPPSTDTDTTTTPPPTTTGTTPPPQSPPVPVFGKSFVAGPTQGTVLIKKPGSSKFVPLTALEEIPPGSTIDATKGRVTIRVAIDAKGTTQEAVFYGGIFTVSPPTTTAKLRATTVPSTALTTVVLKGAEKSLAKCPKPRKPTRRASSSATKKKAKILRRLFGSAKGRFRTRGKYAAATVRGTKWRTEDSCDGTRISVTEGSVDVRNRKTNKSTVVRKGKSLLVKAF